MLIVSLGFILDSVLKKTKAIKEARSHYDRCLAALKAAPANAEAHQEALAAGRKLATLTRNQHGATVFDEVALMNDLNAAGARNFPSQAAPSSPPTTTSVIERFTVLEDLKARGLITPDEYKARRQALLDEV